jgi:hypothetical protein
MKELFIKIREADIRNIVAIITSLGCFVMLYLLIVKDIPTSNHDIVVAGVSYILGQSNGSVYGYLFGTTKGEKKQPPDTSSKNP